MAELIQRLKDKSKTKYHSWTRRPSTPKITHIPSTSMPPTETSDPSSYPDPLIIPPASGTHKHSIIILHGRGSNASAFAPPLLALDTEKHGKLQDIFPSAKFIFPTPSRRVVARSGGKAVIQQWFDFWSLEKPDERFEIQFEGLRESVEWIHGLMREEIEEVGAGNVVLWGLSQGCATSLVAMLLWEGEGIAACVGMCGWLPLRKQMEEVLRSDSDDHCPGPGQASDRLETAIASGQDAQQHSPLARSISHLRNLLDLPSPAQQRQALTTPIWMGHGGADHIVPVEQGKEAVLLLKNLGVDVEYQGYPTLGHWYSEGMLSDIVEFLKDRTDWR